MSFARNLFRVAGVYGVLGLVPQYFLEEKLGRDFPPPMNHPEHFYAFLGVALAWQVLFFILAKDPVRYRLMMIPAALEKIGFGAAGVILVLLGRAAPLVLVAGLVDLLFAALFLVAFKKTPVS